jgi:hypothetical protein
MITPLPPFFGPSSEGRVSKLACRFLAWSFPPDSKARAQVMLVFAFFQFLRARSLCSGEFACCFMAFNFAECSDGAYWCTRVFFHLS